MSDTTETEPSSAPPPGVSEGACTPVVLTNVSPGPSVRRGVPVVLKLTLLVGLTLALLLAVLVTANGLFWRSVLRKTADSYLSGVASSRRDLVRAQISLLRQRAELNADRGELRGFFYGLSQGSPSEENRKGSQETLDRMIRDKPLISASLADAAGHIVLSTYAKAVGRDISKEPEFERGMAQTTIGLPRAAEEHRYRMVVTAPVRSRTEAGRVYGVLTTTSDITDLANALRDTTGLGETGDTLLAVREGNQLHFLFPPRNTPQVEVVPLGTATALRAATAGAEVLVKDVDYRGVPVIAAGRPIGFGDWTLIVKMDAQEA